MKKFLLMALVTAMVTSCSYRLVPKAGPYFQYKERKAKEAKAGKPEFDNRKY